MKAIHARAGIPEARPLKTCALHHGSVPRGMLVLDDERPDLAGAA